MHHSNTPTKYLCLEEGKTIVHCTKVNIVLCASCFLIAST